MQLSFLTAPLRGRGGKILPKSDASQMAQVRSTEQFATRTSEKPKRLRVKEPQSEAKNLKTGSSFE